MRKKITRIVAVLGTATAMALGVVTTSSAATATTQRQLDEIHRLYPNAKQVGPRSLEVENGVVISAPAPDGVQASCSYEWICLFDGTGYSGYEIDFTVCAFRNLGDYSFPGGGRWNDKVSSFINNQTSGTTSYFYNWDGVSNWVYLFSSTAYNARNPSPYSNIIDALWVC